MNLPLICPDFERECRDMTYEEALNCFKGCQGHPCMPPDWEGLGEVDGVCPILSEMDN